MKQGGSGRILIAEDEASVRELLRELLCEEGYQVDVVINGLEAEELLLNRDSYALLITDMKMPIKGGLDLIARARQIDDSLPIIAVTGYPRDEMARQALDRGASEFLIKPFKIEQLIRLVHNYIRPVEDTP